MMTPDKRTDTANRLADEMATGSDQGIIDPWQTRSAMIRNVVQESADVSTYEIELPGSAFEFRPGQFNMLYVPGVGESAISIAGLGNDQNRLRHTIRTVGNVTEAIETGGVGMQIGMRGPFGSSWPIKELTHTSNRNLIVVAGGLGLAPLRSLIEFVVERRDTINHVNLLIGARTPDDIIYERELASWRENQIDLELTVDRPADGWKGHVGVVTLLLERLHVAEPERTMLVTCGPEVMMRYVTRSALNHGIPPENVWLSMERNMNCAIGLCGHCQLGPTFICKDGPVFRFDKIREWLRIQDL